MRKPEQVGKSHDYSSHHQPHSTCRKGVVKKDEKKNITTEKKTIFFDKSQKIYTEQSKHR